MRLLQNISIATLLVLVSCFTVFAQSETQMEDDAEKLHDIYRKVKAIKDFRMPDGVWKRIGENYPAFQAALDRMNKTRLIRDDHAGYVAEFKNKYAGGASEEFRIVKQLNDKFKPLDLGYDPGDEYQEIMFRFGILDTAGEQNASIALKKIRGDLENPSHLKALHEIYRVKSIEESKNLLTILPMFDPGNERIARRVSRLQGQVEEALKEYRAEEMRVLQSRRWQGNIGGTSAGSPASLAAAGKRFVTSQPDWGGNTAKGTKILKVSIRGDWFVAERSFGRPTRYGLPAAIAVSDNTMDPGVVTVYEVSLITKFPKMEPNFYGLWVGKVWRMLDKNLPK